MLVSDRGKQHSLGRVAALSRRVWVLAAITLVLFLPVTARGVRPPMEPGRPASVRKPSRLHELSPSVTSFAADGVRYAAWQTPQGTKEEKVVVLDTLTGRRRTVTLPDSCNLVAENDEGFVEQSAAAGRFLLNCFTVSASGETAQADRALIARSGRTIPLRRGFEWLRMGARYVEGDREIVGGEGGKFISSIATGRVWRAREGALVDLDRPGAPGEGAICARLRRRVRQMEGTLGLGRDYGYRHGLLVRPERNKGEIAIEHCRGRPIVFEGQQGSPARYFELRGGLLSFDTGQDPGETEQKQGEELSGATVQAYELASGARYSWRLPGLHGYSSHTANMVFWIPTRKVECDELCFVETFAVYGARVPRR